ncbi:ring-cleaving dioxygenase [soil metagenome]
MTKGIHHITAIASDGQKNHYFYSHILGLRLVKKTVNQDDIGTYHLFFGDREGHPGMDLTFFIFKPSMQGKRGNGLVTTISLAVPEDSLTFWQERFVKQAVKHEKIVTRFGKKRILFYDADDQQLELVGLPTSELDETKDLWTTKEIRTQHAIRHFYSATLSMPSKVGVEEILVTAFGYKPVLKEETITLYEVQHSKRAAFLEIDENPSREFGLNAAGTIHHIAFRARDEAHQLELQQAITNLGIQTTQVIDRFYFKSIYFRTSAGILFEIATDTPGFTADENVEELGTKIALPPFLESKRALIESNLPVIK